MEDLALEAAAKLEAYMAQGPGCKAAAIEIANRWLWEADKGGLRLLDGAREVLERIAQQGD